MSLPNNSCTGDLLNNAEHISVAGISGILSQVFQTGTFLTDAVEEGCDLSDEQYSDYCSTLALFLAEMSQVDLVRFLRTFR